MTSGRGAVILKLCEKCKETKPVSSFYHNVRMADGLHPICKRCRRLTDSAYRRTQQVRIEKIRARMAKRHLEDYVAMGHQHRPPTVQICDQRIVPMLVSVFEQIGSKR